MYVPVMLQLVVIYQLCQQFTITITDLQFILVFPLTCDRISGLSFLLSDIPQSETFPKVKTAVCVGNGTWLPQILCGRDVYTCTNDGKVAGGQYS